MNIIFPRSKPGSSCPGCLLPGGEPGCNGCHPAGCDCKEEKLRRKLALVKFQPEAWNGGVLPRADRAQAQAHAVAPIGVDGDQEAATIFLQHGGVVFVHNMDNMGNTEERSECTIRLMASWQGDRWLSEKPGARRGRDSYTNVVALSPSSPTLHRKANCKSTLEVFFFELLIKLLTSSPLSPVSDLLAG